MKHTHSPIRTVICYDPEDSATVENLCKHLKQLERKGILEIWYRDKLEPGDQWDKSIKYNIESAQLILLLISVDFIASEHIEKLEMREALQNHKEKGGVMIPIIVRHCKWEDYFDIGQLEVLPKGGNPINSNQSESINDEIMTHIVKDIDKIAKSMLAKLYGKPFEEDKQNEHIITNEMHSTNIEDSKHKQNSPQYHIETAKKYYEQSLTLYLEESETNLKDAEEIVNKAIREYDYFGDAYYLRGLIRHKSERYDHAILDFHTALDKNVSNPDNLYFCLAVSYCRIKNITLSLKNIGKIKSPEKFTYKIDVLLEQINEIKNM